MNTEMVTLIERHFNAKVYEIKYVDIDSETSVVSKLNGFKGFADYALTVIKNLTK